MNLIARMITSGSVLEAWALGPPEYDISDTLRFAGVFLFCRDVTALRLRDFFDLGGADGEACPENLQRTGNIGYEYRLLQTKVWPAETGEKMYYVIQVAPGTEQKTETLIRERVETGLYGRCFHPLRHVRKKFRGEWRDMHEKLMPGYVFITSTSVADLYQELRRVPALTKLLGRNEGGVFVPLAEKEADWLEKITEGGTEAALSQVAVAEGDMITILSGPLTDMEGRIRKIHLHKRIAEVEVNFMNRKTVIHLGIELVGKDGKWSI